MKSSTGVLVIGGGVSGLTTAVVLAERGHEVVVWSREPSEETTSALAGGLWWPYRIEPAAKVAHWSLRSFEVFSGLAPQAGKTGVRMVPGVQAGIGRQDLGAWAASLPGLRPAEADELPQGYPRGLRATVPLIDMATYLRYLRRRLESAGGRLEQRGAQSLAEAGESAPYVVNCSALGARELAGDATTVPVQGQLVIVENPGIEEWFVAADASEAETVYLFPQPYGLVLGGTAVEGAWGTKPDPATAAAIAGRCARVFPKLAEAAVLGHRVGLRPARPNVRIEAEPLPGGALCVHNYGHGGAGITVSWGCAEEAAALVPLSSP